MESLGVSALLLGLLLGIVRLDPVSCESIFIQSSYLLMPEMETSFVTTNPISQHIIPSSVYIQSITPSSLLPLPLTSSSVDATSTAIESTHTMVSSSTPPLGESSSRLGASSLLTSSLISTPVESAPTSSLLTSSLISTPVESAPTSSSSLLTSLIPTPVESAVTSSSSLLTSSLIPTPVESAFASSLLTSSLIESTSHLDTTSSLPERTRDSSSLPLPSSSTLPSISPSSTAPSTSQTTPGQSLPQSMLLATSSVLPLSPTSVAATSDTESTGGVSSEPGLLSPLSSPMSTVMTVSHAPEEQTTPISSPTPTSTTTGGGNIWDKIRNFFEEEVKDNKPILVAFVLGPVVVILLVVVVIFGCCCVCSSSRRKNKRRFNLASSRQPSTLRNGVSPTYRPRSRNSLHEMRQHMDADAFYSEYPYQTASQPYHSTVAMADSVFIEPLPQMSPLSYPSQLRNYMSSPEHPSSPTPRISLSGSPGGMQRFPGSSPSLHRPTPLGQQLQKKTNSTHGSRTSIQGSRASISALGSRTSFSGSRNSFLSSNNTMSRDEMRSSGILASNKAMSEEEAGSQLSFHQLIKPGSLDMVPTRESPVPQSSQQTSQRRDFVNMTITNPMVLEEEGGMEGREEGDGVDENDLRKDPLVPVMTSTPANQGGEEFPTRQGKKANGSQKAEETSNLMSPRKKNLRQLTSLSRQEGEATASAADAAPTPPGAAGRSGEGTAGKEEKPKSKPMSRLEKLTSLDYLRSSIRRSLKKKRVSFLTRTPPDTTPKTKKKTPPRSLPTAEPKLEPDPLTFSNQGAFDTEEPMLSPRIHTPSPLSPEFETVDEYRQRYPDDYYHPEVYPETHALRHPYPVGGGRMRAYSDMAVFAPQLSQPTYYPSTMHYPQTNYPQLSQQYIPPSYVPPQLGFLGSPAHRSLAPMPPQPAMHHPPTLHPQENYGRRYTDSAAVGGSASGPPRTGGGRGGASLSTPSHERSVADHHRISRTKSPEMSDTTSNVSDVRVHSPDTGPVPGHDPYFEAPLRFRSIPTSPEERPYSPPYYPMPGAGGGVPYRERSVRTQPAPHYTDYPADNHQPGSGSYRQTTVDNQQVRSPLHHSERMVEDYPRHDGRYRRSSIEHPPQMSSHRRQGSAEMQPMMGNRVRRSSIDNQPPPPIASHIRRSSIDNPPPHHFRRSSFDGQPPSTGRRPSIDEHPGVQYRDHAAGFQPIMEPRPYRNGMGMDGVWGHSQRDEQYGMGSQLGGMGSQLGGMGLLGWEDEEDDARTPTERPVDSGTSTAKAKVSWNNEIIEHLRTPSDCSDHYDQ